MSWIEKLYETYENVVDKFDIKPWPVSHFVKNAHIEVVIDKAGNLKRVNLLSGENAATLIPATEESAGKAGAKIAPHPLSDELNYCALDLPKPEDPKKKLDAEEKKKAFFEQINKWRMSEFNHSKVEAIHAYLRKGCLWKDISERVDLPIKFKSKSGQMTVTAEKTFVRWKVEEENNPVSETWKDDALIQSWINFDKKYNARFGLCSVIGLKGRIASNHSRFLRHSGDGAKIVSSNDTSGYTYRGKFVSSDEAIHIGFDVTQKSHNALRWLIGRQGIRNGDQVIVIWAVSGKNLPEATKSTFDFDNFDEVGADQQKSDEKFENDHSIDAGQSFAKQLRKYMQGYKTNLRPDESIVIMGLDSATPGRMSIIYYREYFAHEYIDIITKWHEDFAWFQRIVKEIPQQKGKPKTKVEWIVCAPSGWNVVNAGYGDVVKSNDSLKKNVIERLLPCIVEGKNVPIDIVNAAIKRASNPLSMERWEWEKSLGVACALYKGLRLRISDKNKQRSYSMGLEKCKARDYLYGRLLAVAESIEGYALYLSNEKRLPTAIRMMQRFADRPFSTWRTIELALQPYIQRLQNMRGGFVNNRQTLISEIMTLFENEEFKNDKALSGEFLLGFHVQRLELKKSKEEKDTNIEDDQGGES